MAGEGLFLQSFGAIERCTRGFLWIRYKMRLTLRLRCHFRRIHERVTLPHCPPSAFTHTYPRPPLPAGHPLRFPLKKTPATNRSSPSRPPTFLPMDRLCGKPPSPTVRLEPSSVKLKSISSQTFTRRGLTAHTQRARRSYLFLPGVQTFFEFYPRPLRPRILFLGEAWKAPSTLSCLREG